MVYPVPCSSGKRTQRKDEIMKKSNHESNTRISEFSDSIRVSKITVLSRVPRNLRFSNIGTVGAILRNVCLLLVTLLLAMGGNSLHAGENITILPGVASAPGAEGTHWLSDLEILNTGNSTLELTISFFPFDSNGTAASEETFSITPGELASYSDILSRLQSQGAGTLILKGDSPFLAGMRTYNQGDEGSYGQFIPSQSFMIQDFKQEYGGQFLPGIVEDGSYRCNFGVFNAAGSAVSFSINGVQKSLDVHGGWQKAANQVASVDGEGDTFGLEGDPVVSYLSVIDNQTGDPTFIPAQMPSTVGTLAGVAHQAGAQGSLWRSDLFIHAEEDARIHLEFRRWGETGGPGSVFSITAGQTLILRDIVSRLTEGDGGGIIHYRASEAVSIAARTYNQSEGGTYGQSITPIQSMDEGYLLFAAESEDFRANLALFNPGTSRATYELELFSATGGSLGQTTISLDGGAATQINHVVERFGLQTLSSGYIKVSGGVFGGYLSSIDNRSGDGSTILPLNLKPEARISGPGICGKIRSTLDYFSRAGFEITVTSLDDPEFEDLHPLLDSNGRFFVELPCPGEYWVLAKDGEGQYGGRWISVRNHAIKTEIFLSPGEDDSGKSTSDTSGTLESGTFSLTITVLEACEDAPVSGARVALYTENTEIPEIYKRQNAVTDASGRAIFITPIKEKYANIALGVTPPPGFSAGCEKLFLWSLAAIGDDLPFTFHVKGDNYDEECTATIRGTVVDDFSGEPIEDATVWLRWGNTTSASCDEIDSDMSDRLQTWETDAQGNFEITHILPGFFGLSVTGPISSPGRYWSEEESTEVFVGDSWDLLFPMREKGIRYFATVWDREDPATRMPVEGAMAELTNVNPLTDTHGPVVTRDGGLLIFDVETPGDYQGGTSGNLRIHLEDPQHPECTVDHSFDMTTFKKWSYDDEFVLPCPGRWEGNYTTTLELSEDFGGATISTSGEADGEISFQVDDGILSGTAEDTQRIVYTTPGCTTTYDGSGEFEITGIKTNEGFRLFFDDNESFVYAVRTECQGAPPSTSTETGAARLQYAPKIEIEVNEDGNTAHFEETHTVEHIGTYTMVLDVSKR